MKVTKKLLSVFLAVLMIMSSMSVCFGVEVFAATSETSEFIEAVQCDAMKNFSATYSTTSSGSNPNLIRTNTYSVTAANYTQFLELIEVIKAFDNAVQSLGEYTNKHSHSNDSNCAASTTVCTDFGALRTALVNDIGSSDYNTLNSTYNLGAFLDCVLSMTNISYARSLNNYHKKTGYSYSSQCPVNFFNDLVVSVDYMSYFTSKTDTDELTDDEIYTTYTYRTAMGRQLYKTSASWGRTNYFGHSCVNTFQVGYFSKHTEGTKTATNRDVLQDMKTVLVNNEDYLDETTMAGVHKISTSPATLNAVAKELEDAYTALKNKLGTNAQTLFDHFFKADYISYGTSVDNLIALIKKAAVIAGYKSSCETIAKDYKIYTDETYKTYTSTEVNALYNELKTAYEGYKAADDTMEAEIATYYGIDDIIGDVWVDKDNDGEVDMPVDTDGNGTADSGDAGALPVLLAYYYEIFLGSIDERAFGKDGNPGYVGTWQLWTVEDIDNDVVTSADILTALKEINLDIDTLNSDATDEDVQGYFGMSKDELLGILGTVKTHLENLGYYAGLNDQLYEQYYTFTNNISSVIDADSSTLYNVLSGYESWHQNLQTFFTNWSNEVGEYKDLLEDDLQETMNTYMQEAYAALKARVVTQIDNAYGLYEVYYDMYGNNVTMASLTYFNTLKKAIEAIEHDAYSWMLNSHSTYGTAIDETSIARYDALQVIYGAYGTFVANRGFDTYTQTVVNTVREDTEKDIARENENGKYEVADGDIEKIIDLLEAALKDENIKKLLGDLINKENLDENGNPKPFDLAELINGLINDNLYSDNIVNTIISFLYPVVAKAFLDVWIGIDPVVNTTADTDMGTLPVSAKLLLYDVDTAIEAAGLALAPANLGNFMAKNGYASKYPTIIAQLQAVTAKTRYAADGTYADPWKAADLYEDAVDEEGNVIIDEETGEAKQVMTLDWGIDEAEDKKAAFIDAATAALCGLEPLLKALLLNQKFVSPNIVNDKQRGGKIGTSLPGTTVKAFGLTLDLTLDPITLMLDISANDGYDNVLAPLFELLGLTNIPHGESMTGVRDFVQYGLLGMIDQLVEKLAANPLKTILDIVPNLVYALEADLVAPVLNFLETNIYYEADTHYSANAYLTKVTGDLAGVMKAEKPEYINVGQMLDLESMGLNLSGGLAGILEMLGISIPMPDVSVLATAGELVWKDTNRSKFTYSYAPQGKEGKAAHIVANRADVLEYIFKWALGNLGDILGALNIDISGLGEVVSAIFANLAANADAATAGVVELLNQKAYNTLKTYEWFNPDTYALPTVEGFTPATQIYMNPGNDWTEAKAQYLYDNLETLLTSIFTMANLDLDKETEGVQTSLEDLIGGLVNGLFTDKTLTALAGLLAKLDLNALTAPKAEGEDANVPETVAEGEATEGEAEAVAIDLNALVKDLLGLDLAAVAAQYADTAAALEADPEYVDNSFGVDAAEDKAAKFVDELVKMLTPLSAVLDFVLTGGTLDITFAKGTADEKSTSILGGNGYNTALIPLLEALGCEVTTATTGIGALEATLNALVGLINKLTTNDPAVEKDGLIYGVIDLLPGLLYFLSSNGLSTAVYNLLHPVYVLLDTIRPIYDVDINALLAGIEIGEEGNKKPLGLDLNKLNTEFVIKLVSDLTGLNLSGLNTVIYDVCKVIGVDYSDKAKSTLQTTWKKGAYTADFTQADLLTVLLSFILEWATVEENAEALDELLNTNGIIASLNTVFADVEIEYGTPNWGYWFENQDAFDAYLEDPSRINTLASLDWENIGDNDWDQATALYFAENLDVLVDTVIAMINKDKADAPQTLAELLSGLVNGLVNADTLNDLVGMLAGLLEGVDDNLLELAGYILGDSSTDKKEIDIVGLKSYTCEAEINSISDFINELANVLDTYASGLVDWLFFGNDFRFAKKSVADENGEYPDTIVINGGLGYEKGLAMILEALGCELPEEANTKSVLAALATRVDAILADPIDEVIALLPNLVYFLNANGAGVAVDNLLKPVNALLTKLQSFGLNVNLNELIGIDLANLSLANVVSIVEGATGLTLDAAENILVNFCTGKISKGEYIYKMEAAPEDTITILLVVVFELLYDDTFAAQLDAMLDLKDADGNPMSIVATIKEIIAGAEPSYKTPEWNYMEGKEKDGVIEYVNKITEYPNDWTEDKAEYLAENLPALVDTVIKMIEINGVKYESLSALLKANVNIFTSKTLDDIVGLLKNLLGGIDEELLKVGFLLDVKLVDVKDEEGNVVVPGLMSYTAPEGITTVDAFAAELANVLSTYAPGVVEWLLLGRDFNLLVKDADGIEEGLVANGSYVTIKGAQGYAEGLALLLEALGCENLPEVYNVENLDTAATVKAVLDSLAARIDEIFANPVKEVLDLLPNLIYFLDADGVDAVINNTTAALMALVGKLSVFGINLDINALVDLPELMGIADKYAEGDDKVALDNLTLKALLKAVSLMTGLDLTELEDVLYPFALGEAVKYDSVSANDAYKMQYKNDYDKHDMITVLVTAVLRVAFETEGNAEVLADLLGTDIISSIEEVFASVEITYSKPNWDYNLGSNDTVDAMKYAITYPNNWSEATAEYVTTTIMSKEFDALVAGLIDSNYASLSALLNDKVNVFTSENLDAIVKLIADLLKDIDDGLLAAAGVILDVNVVGLKSYKAPEGITTVKAFAAELANILNTYAPGVVEWLLLGEDYRFFVNKEADGETVKYVDFITINGAEGYANGLALLLEALGCKDLPAADGDTKAIVEGVLTSLANRIDEIFANPVKEVVNLLPNLLYFLNTNGVAAVIDNTIAALTALLGKLETFGVKLDINELVNLKKLMKIEDTDATISLDNLAMADLLQAVGYMTGLNLSLVEDVLVNFGLVKAEAYASVSDKTAVGEAKKMGYEEDVFETHDMVTVLANLVLLTLVAEDNAEFVKGLVGEDIYQVILNLLNMQEAEIQEFSWMYTDRVGETFSTLETSGLYDDWPLYGPLYTEEMATYIADNFGEFVDNILYLLGLEINGVQINDLTTLINELLDGSLYNSSNVIAIRDALAGVLAKVENLEVKGVVVGGYIADVLKAAGIADIKAVANVNVPEFEKNKEMFVASLCDVLEPLYGILKFVLANEDISFFVDLDKNDLITLNGGEGYAYGIVPLLEVLGCENILTPDAYYAAVKADGDVLLTSILDPLLKRVDVIIADPANEILAILPNIIYFINSNGLDTVVKNTLNAVYSILGAIEPIAKIDLYELIGVDLSKINMNWLVDKLLGILADAGYDFDLKDIDPIAELTVGTLEQYTSLNGKTAYRMVYTPDGSIEGSSAELVTVILRLLVTFLMHEKNAEIVVDFLSDNLGMSPDAKDYIDGVIKAIAKVPTTTYLGMDQALAVIYYLFYGADIGSGALAGGLKDINAEWQNIMKELGKSDDPNEQTIGNILAGLMKDFDTEDVLGEDGVATNGLISFFQKIADWFNKIIEWFKNLFK